MKLANGFSILQRFIGYVFIESSTKNWYLRRKYMQFMVGDS